MSPPIASPLPAPDIQRYQRDGYLVVPDILTDAEIDAFLDHERQPKPPEMQLGLRTFVVDPCWHALANHPRVVGIVEQLLGGRARIVQAMFLDKPAEGGRGIALHQDLYYIKNEPETLMACWLALADADRDNGGLCVVPDSHGRGLYPHAPNEDAKEHQAWESAHVLRDRQGQEWQEPIFSAQVQGLDRDRIVCLSVPRGAGVFFPCTVIHGSFANHSPNRPRPAFPIHYVREGTWVYRTDIQDTVPARPEVGREA